MLATLLEMLKPQRRVSRNKLIHHRARDAAMGPEQEHSATHSLISAFTSFHFQ